MQLNSDIREKNKAFIWGNWNTKVSFSNVDIGVLSDKIIMKKIICNKYLFSFIYTFRDTI